jgi:signal transduction histidine kinase
MNTRTTDFLQDPEQRQAQGIETVSWLARRINASLDLAETLDASVHAVAELVPCTLAEIDLWDDERQVLVLQALHSTPEREFPIGEAFPPGEGYTGWVVRHRQPLLVPDVDTCPYLRPDLLPGEYPFQAYLGLPLLAGDDLIGALVLVHDEAGAFDESDLRLSELLAGQAAIAIQNARIYEELARRHSEVSALYAVAEAINNRIDLQDLLESALESVISVTKASAAGIRLLDPKSGVLSFVASKGLSADYLPWIGAAQLDKGITGRVAQIGEPILIPDVLARPISNPDFRAALEKEGLRARLEVALRSREDILGTLGIASREPDSFGQEDIDLLVAIGGLLGVAIENEQLRQNKLQEERLAAIGRVATGVAHDLRSPLGGILRSAEFLGRGEISQETRAKLNHSIVSLARRLIGASQQILDYVQGQKIRLQVAPIDLSSFLEEVLEVMQVDLSDRGIEVVQDYRYEDLVVIDADRMAQVVFNLVSNARDAMPSGGKITLCTDLNGDQIEIRFSDSGTGIPGEFAERIFDPFFSYGKGQGAGLGLAISRQIVQEHGGKIRLESKQGLGATFVISLPAQ